MNTKTLYFTRLIAVAALLACGFLLLPAFDGASAVSAQKGSARSGDVAAEIAAKEALLQKQISDQTAQKSTEREVATPAMLSRALDLRSATDLTVYGDTGVSDNGSSSVKGNVLSGDAPSAKAELSRKDLSNAFSAINQLPCTEVADADLSGKSFGAGVYCVGSAELAGQMVLDGAGDTGAIFVFRIGGAFNVKSGASVSLTGAAQAANVFFAGDDTITIGEGTNLRGNLLGRNAIKIGAGAVVEGRALSVKGDVALNGGVLAPSAPGFIEICKAIDTTPIIGATQFSENFDGVTAPALPATFTSTNLSGTTNLFTTTTTPPSSPPNAAFAADIATISANALTSSQIFDVFTNSQLRFQINTNLENGAGSQFDGVVLEVSVNGAPFQDILATGSTFASGGYNGTIDNRFNNPLGGRQGFTGNSNGYVNTIVNLSPALTGQNLQFRFVLGTDSSNAFGTPTGVFIDNVVVGAPTANTGLENRIFQFRIGSLITEVPAGQCSGPISIEAGPITIEELLTGRTTTGGTFNGNFQLTDVRQLTNLGQPNTTALVSANLPLRLANVNVVAGDVSAQTRLQFTNRFAIIGVVEICKEGIDSGVTGFFNFTIDGVRTGLTTGPLSNGQLTTPAPLQQFTVPVGQCTGPIAVTGPSDVNSGPPRQGQATIREQARTGFLFTSATTALGTAGTPTNRLINFNAFGSGAGDATVVVVAGNDGGNGTNISGAGGATTVQTTVFFNNRTAPGQLKVCKIAGPGIAQLTPFTFTVGGTVPFAPVTVDMTVPVTNGSVLGTSATVLTSGLATTQTPSQGTARVAPAPAATLQGGTFNQFNVTVLAGPASNPGGFCQIVPTTFVVDTAAFVVENGPATTTIVNADGSSTGVTGQVRISRITSTTGIISLVNNNQLTTCSN